MRGVRSFPDDPFPLAHIGFSMAKRDFTWTSERQAVTVWTAVAPAIAAIVAALLVLGLSVKIYCNPHTRGSLKRQSLQVLISVQAASIVYSATYM